MSRIALKATVAFTPPGGRNRNRLRPAHFGVTDFRLATSGGGTSRCHRPAPFPMPAGGEDGFHFAPELESVDIRYQLTHSAGLARTGRLELFTRHQKKPLWTRELSSEELNAGEHRLPWDGRVPVCEAFPDGVVTVEHSPYKLKLTLQGSGWAECPVAWTYFHVLVDGLELELGDPRVLAKARDREVTAAMERLPAPGQRAEVRLVGNVFKTDAKQMEDDADFQNHRREWGNGPDIPIFARAWLKDSQGRRVDAPRALGRVRFLWDWEDEAEDLSRHSPRTRAFLEGALNRQCAVSRPKGDNAHKDVGGKRGLPSSAVFPKQGGYAPQARPREGVFPFRVVPCRKRGWAAYSEAWTSGAFAGRTGVLFQPSRIAGDAWRVTVQLAYERRKDGGVALDVEDDAPLPAAVRASTGIFETWREVHISRIVRKNPSVEGFSLATVQQQFERAFLRLEDCSGGVTELDAADYNRRIAAAVKKRPWEARAAIDPTVDQYAAGGHALTFRTYGAFLAEVKRLKRCGDAELPLWLSKGHVKDAVTDEDTYHRLCKGWAKEILVTAFDEAPDRSTPGILLLQFAGLYNLERAPGGIPVNGFSTEFPSKDRTRCAVVQCGAAANYAGNSNTLEQTIAHEIGHQLFLPHAPFPIHRQPGGANATQHDQDGSDCLMGYDFTVARRLCGLCLLRLRGWNKRQLSSDGSRNAQP
ncbi:hypothetical protein HPC49_34535 [Pyxidicoccus fallax]|uniref:Uncharacterized protein n=1 Tax=Pyxidicoccus fallax TaxID=394095 RepID=A0A848LW31_9BACT|nr:hypothetical protein [Pyxidicoccus fallax]NMO21859.1 hypothetical protein [Pyxidicoccus fallax]NPC83327.1 hypothetical protein [Pyxidicoccus fallax]